MQKVTQLLLFKEQNKNKYVKMSKTINKERKVKWEKALERKNQMEYYSSIKVHQSKAVLKRFFRNSMHIIIYSYDTCITKKKMAYHF